MHGLIVVMTTVVGAVATWGEQRLFSVGLRRSAASECPSSPILLSKRDAKRARWWVPRTLPKMPVRSSVCNSLSASSLQPPPSTPQPSFPCRSGTAFPPSDHPSSSTSSVRALRPPWTTRHVAPPSSDHGRSRRRPQEAQAHVALLVGLARLKKGLRSFYFDPRPDFPLTFTPFLTNPTQ